MAKLALPEGVVLCAHRLVTTNALDPAALEGSFYSNKRKGRRARGREINCPAIWDGLSCFYSLQGARDLYGFIAPKLKRAGKPVAMGNFVAELRLVGGTYEVWYKDRHDPTGHITIWAAPLDLAGAVVDIHDA